MSGRRYDIVWLYFDKLKLPGKTGCRAKCKKCGKEKQGLVARMKQHLVTIQTHPYNLEERERATSPIRLDPPAKRHKPVVSNNDNFVMQASRNEKAAIDLQIARFVCATNSPFSIVEHPKFLKLLPSRLSGTQSTQN